MRLDLIDNFVFDFDHTLIDTEKAFSAYRQTLLQQLHLLTGLPFSEIDIAIAETEKRLCSQFFANRLDLVGGSVGEKLLKKMGELERRRVGIAVQAGYYSSLRAEPPILCMLEYAVKSGKTLFMFTGGSPAHTMGKLTGSGLWQYFKCVFTGDLHPFEDSLESGITCTQISGEQLPDLPPIVSLGPNPKSDAHGYKLLATRAGIRAERSLMIGNNLRDDVRSAQEAGFYAAQARWFDQDTFAAVVPDMVLDEPASLFA